MYVLENRAVLPNRIDQDGRIRDEQRLAYLSGYLGAVLDTIAAGILVCGYFYGRSTTILNGLSDTARGSALCMSISPALSDGPRNSFHFYAQLANGAGLERE
jgi:beta-glucosidase